MHKRSMRIVDPKVTTEYCGVTSMTS